MWVPVWAPARLLGFCTRLTHGEEAQDRSLSMRRFSQTCTHIPSPAVSLDVMGYLCDVCLPGAKKTRCRRHPAFKLERKLRKLQTSLARIPGEVVCCDFTAHQKILIYHVSLGLETRSEPNAY
ncbi:hypothetical protein F5Y17DRAFT_240206 [Xylariaceae sp. FL0594]|nr:hypothetical protein F5Y17DRAFT_240206 [Xylariaceae sp. FL0594]